MMCRLTERLSGWSGSETLADSQHRGGIGHSQRHMDSGVLPPYAHAAPLRGLVGTFIGMHRQGVNRPPSTAPSIHIGESGVVTAVPRPGLAPAWGEASPSAGGKRRVAGKNLNLDSDRVGENMLASARAVPSAADEAALTQRKRVLEVLSGRSRDAVLTHDAPQPAESVVSSNLRARTAGHTWGDVFKKFPRESDGTVPVSSFVSTLRKLATGSAAPGARALTDDDIHRVVALCDPARTGSVSFDAFSRAFSRATHGPAHTSISLAREDAAPVAAAAVAAGEDTARESVDTGRGGAAPAVGGHESTLSSSLGAHRKDRVRVPLLVAADSVSDAATRRVRALAKGITDMMSRKDGSHPSAVRKLFARFPHTADGSVAVEDVVTHLKKAGVPAASSDDVAALLGTSTRVTYDTFARAVAASVLAPASQTMEAGNVVNTNAMLRAANMNHSHEQMSSTAIIDALTTAPAASREAAATAADDVDSEPAAGVTSKSTQHVGDVTSLSRGRAPGAYATVYGNYVAGKDSSSVAGTGGVVDPDRVATHDALTRVRTHLDKVGVTPTSTFLRVDAQRDGVLTHGEVRNGLKSMGVAVSDDDLTRVLTLMDPHKCVLSSMHVCAHVREDHTLSVHLVRVQ